MTTYNLKTWASPIKTIWTFQYSQENRRITKAKSQALMQAQIKEQAIYFKATTKATLVTAWLCSQVMTAWRWHRKIHYIKAWQRLVKKRNNVLFATESTARWSYLKPKEENAILVNNSFVKSAQHVFLIMKTPKSKSSFVLNVNSMKTSKMHQSQNILKVQSWLNLTWARWWIWKI